MLLIQKYFKSGSCLKQEMKINNNNNKRKIMSKSKITIDLDKMSKGWFGETQRDYL